MAKSSSSVLIPLPNQPTWLQVGDTNWIAIKDPSPGNPDKLVYNLRDKNTHRPAEYFEMMEVLKLLEDKVGTYEVWVDLSARCTYIAYNTVKQIGILQGQVKLMETVAENRRIYWIEENKKKAGWMWLALGSIAVDAVIAFIVLST